MVEIPNEYLDVYYNAKQIPGSEKSIFTDGANCQLFAYTLLKHFGYKIPPFRSSNLWEDTQYTKISENPKAFDLMLYHSKPEAWGAHVGLYIGDDKVIHLSNEIGKPEIREHEAFAELERYAYFIGSKQPLEQIKI